MNEMFDEQPGNALMAQRDAAAVARATQEIQAALVIGQRAPRDEIKCKGRILEACKRKELAEVAEYEYSRGGTRITGPTIDLLRAIANRWGNIRFGWTEVERKEGMSMVRCFAWDVQTNSQAERTFTVKHWRDTQGGGYALEDERDIYELLANHAARRVRACLEEVIDSDIVNAAVDQCRRTLRDGEKTPLADRAVAMAMAFAEFGVTQTMLEAKLGNKLEAISDNQLASLRRIFKALKDGVGRREDYFKPEVTKPEFSPAATTAGDAEVETRSKATSAPSLASGPSPAPAGETESPSPLKAVRMALKSRKLPENALLDFLSASGVTQGDCATLEEVQLQYPNALAKVTENWATVADAIERARAK